MQEGAETGQGGLTGATFSLSGDGWRLQSCTMSVEEGATKDLSWSPKDASTTRCFELGSFQM